MTLTCCVTKHQACTMENDACPKLWKTWRLQSQNLAWHWLPDAPSYGDTAGSQNLCRHGPLRGWGLHEIVKSSCSCLSVPTIQQHHHSISISSIPSQLSPQPLWDTCLRQNTLNLNKLLSANQSTSTVTWTGKLASYGMAPLKKLPLSIMLPMDFQGVHGRSWF